MIEINGVKTPNLDAVLAVVSSMRDGEAVRLTLESLVGRPEVDTMKLDLQFWPTFELERDALGVCHGAESAGNGARRSAPIVPIRFTTISGGSGGTSRSSRTQRS